MRRLVVVLLVLVALAVAADRVALHVAQVSVADQVRTSAELQTRPVVRVRGFPFLTQAAQGTYGRIDVTATDVDRGGVRVKRFEATLHDVEVPLSDALHGEVGAVPVGSIDATALVTYADLAHRSGLVGLTIEPAEGGVRVTSRLTVLGQTVRATALSRLSLRGSRIAVTARSLSVLGQSSPALVNALAGRLDLLVPVGELPYGLHLTSLRTTGGGVLLRARSGPTVLTRP
ncbi:MAG TPA: DUF2993 domain-containing protein [Mycobacteriales bacterium]|nr:DUF2993 domain-containing protein [Mycobacteriales bacterium]